MITTILTVSVLVLVIIYQTQQGACYRERAFRAEREERELKLKLDRAQWELSRHHESAKHWLDNAKAL